MLVQPTPVRPRRDRWLALSAAALVVVSLLVATGLAAREPAPTSTPTAVATAVVGGEHSPGPGAARSAVPVRPAELHALVVRDPAQDGSIVAFWGLVPTQFSWADVDIDTGSGHVSGPAVRVDALGSFGGTIHLGPAETAGDRLVIRVSGLNDAQLSAVPLLTLIVGPPLLSPTPDALPSGSP
jgi:hypothetical protein